jgi:hypothetical protein
LSELLKEKAPAETGAQGVSQSLSADECLDGSEHMAEPERCPTPFGGMDARPPTSWPPASSLGVFPKSLIVVEHEEPNGRRKIAMTTSPIYLGNKVR